MIKKSFKPDEVMYAAEDDECFLPNGNNNRNNQRLEVSRKQEEQNRIEQKRYGEAPLHLFKNPENTLQDIKAVQKATRSRWNIRRKGIIKRRLEAIVQQGEDETATAAAKALIQMNAQDQRDDLAELERTAPKNGVTVNVLNANDGRSRVLQFADRLRAAGIAIEDPSSSTQPIIDAVVRTGGIQERSSVTMVQESSLAETEGISVSEQH